MDPDPYLKPGLDPDPALEPGLDLHQRKKVVKDSYQWALKFMSCSTDYDEGNDKKTTMDDEDNNYIFQHYYDNDKVNGNKNNRQQ